jgi:putative FmdB family regulatory protein
VPTYAYACTSCGHEFEVVQSITDPTLTGCPECPGSLRKVFHPVGVAFKGPGFYRTDSRAGSGSTPASSTTGKTGGESGSTTGGDGKPKESAPAGPAASGGSGKGATPASGSSSSGSSSSGGSSSGGSSD